MAAITPHMKDIDLLEPLASRYVDVESLPWKPTPSEGIDMKVLLEDKETGLLTRLVPLAAGCPPGVARACRDRADLRPRGIDPGRRRHRVGRRLRVAADGQPP